MKTSEQLATALLEDVYSYSSTQINLPDNLADFLNKWGKLNVPDKNLYFDEDGGLGREDDMHVTVKYGLLERYPSKHLLEIMDGTAPFTVRLGKVSLFESKDYDVVKLEVDGDELRKLNAAITAQCPNEDKHPKYQPHCTIAYVKKGTAADLVGVYPFASNEDVDPEFEAQELLFSEAGDGEASERQRVMIPFNYLKQESESPKQFMTRRAVEPTSQSRVRITGGQKSFRGQLGTAQHAAEGWVWVTVDGATALGAVPFRKDQVVKIAEAESPKDFMRRRNIKNFEIRLYPYDREADFYATLTREELYKLMAHHAVYYVGGQTLRGRPTRQDYEVEKEFMGGHIATILGRDPWIPITEAESPKQFIKRKVAQRNNSVVIYPWEWEGEIDGMLNVTQAEADSLARERWIERLSDPVLKPGENAEYQAIGGQDWEDVVDALNKLRAKTGQQHEAESPKEFMQRHDPFPILRKMLKVKAAGGRGMDQEVYLRIRHTNYVLGTIRENHYGEWRVTGVVFYGDPTKKWERAAPLGTLDKVVNYLLHWGGKDCWENYNRKRREKGLDPLKLGEAVRSPFDDVPFPPDSSILNRKKREYVRGAKPRKAKDLL